MALVELYQDTVASVDLSGSYVQRANLRFTPSNYTKFVILAHADGLHDGYSEPHGGYDAQMSARLKVDIGSGDVTHCDVVDTTTFSGMTFVETTNQIDVSLELKGSTVTAKRISLIAFGVSDWHAIQKVGGGTIDGPTTDVSEILMQNIFHGKTHDALVFTYGEAAQTITGSQTSRTSMRVFLDEPNNKDKELVNILPQGVSYGQVSYLGFCSMERRQLEKGEHHLAFMATNVAGNGYAARFRNLRCVIIPLEQQPFTTVQPLQLPDPETIDGSDKTEALTKVLNCSTYAGITYLALASSRWATSKALTTTRTLVRYIGGGLTAGTTSDFDTIATDDLLNAVAQRTSISTSDDVFIQGQQQIACRAFNAPSDSQDDKFIIHFDWSEGTPLPVDPSPGNFGTTEHRNLVLLQFNTAEAAITDNFTYDTEDQYAQTTLVEISRPTSIERFSTSTDVYLFDSLTSTEIVNLHVAGDIDDASLVDLTVTGQQALDAINSGDNATAADLLDLNTGLPDGEQSEPVSEYATYSNIGALYKRGVVKDIKISTKSPDAYFGIIGQDNATIEMDNTDGVFTLNYDLDEIIGSDIKVKEYDKINNELRSIFSGKVTDISGVDQIVIKAINPAVDTLDSDLPIQSVSDVIMNTQSGSNVEVLEANDTNASLPIFFGVARRMAVPHVAKSFGSEETDPDFLDAFSDHLVGGPMFNSQFPYVIVDRTYSPSGVYRGWVAVTNSIEFNNETDIIDLDQYQLTTKNIPSLRFDSHIVDTVTRTGLLPFPLAGPTESANIEDHYPDFIPVTELYSIPGFRQGQDYTLTGNIISWNVAGGTNPPVQAAGTTTITLTRGPTTPIEDLSGTNISDIISSQVSEAREFVTISDVAQDGVTYVFDTDYTKSTANRLRVNLEDKVTWGKQVGKRMSYEFTGSLLDGVTGGGNVLEANGLQPAYNSLETAIEFINPDSMGTLSITEANTSPSNQYDISAGVEARLIAYVQQNASGFIEGTVIRKYSGSDGYRIRVEAEPGSGGTKFVAGCDVGNLSLSHTAGTGVTLNDGALHKIEITLVRGTPDVATMYVDNVVGLTGEGTNLDLANGQVLIVGGDSVGTGNFEGIIHKLELYDRSTSEPMAGTTYSVEGYFQPDSFSADWEYTKQSASNPVQGTDGFLTIGGDFRVAGAELVPEALTSTVPVVGSDSFMWVDGPGESGYAVRLNFGNPENAWHLGTGGLDEDSYLGGVGTNGRIEFDNNYTAMKVLGNFSLYGYGIWRGGPSDNAILIAKQSSVASEPSYALGIKGGKAWGMVRANDTVYEVTGTTYIPTKQPVFIMVERNGTSLNVYFNGSLDGTASCGAASNDSDYSTADLVIGHTATILGSGYARWVGDLSFTGLTEFAGGESFAKLMTDMMSRDVKGGFSERYISGVQKKTLFHFPFTEGTGTTIKSRNIHRNPALAIKRILHDDLIGVAEGIDSLSFDKAITQIDDIGLKVDYVETEKTKLSDILNRLAITRGMSVKKDSSGRWSVTVDSADSGITRKFGQGDGVLENIVKINSLSRRSIDQAVKTLVLNYRYFANAEGDVEYHAKIERSVLPYGTKTKTIDMPYVLDHETADRISCYLAKKIKYSATTLNITVGMEGRNVGFGDLVEINIPRLNLTNTTFQVTAVSHGTATRTLSLQSFSPDIFIYDPGRFPEDEDISVGFESQA